MFVPTNPATQRERERERERERTCFFSVPGDRSGLQICQRQNAGRRRRPTTEREAAERDGNYWRVSQREREREGGGGFDGGGELR